MEQKTSARGGARPRAGRKLGPKKILKTYSVYPEDAERLDKVVEEFAPAAFCDYIIEEI